MNSEKSSFNQQFHRIKKMIILFRNGGQTNNFPRTDPCIICQIHTLHVTKKARRKMLFYLVTLIFYFETINTKIQQPTPFGSTVTPFISAFGDLQVGEKVDSFSLMFQFNIPTDLCTSTNSGTGIAPTISIPFAQLQCATGTGVSQLESTQRLRYISAHESYIYFTAIYTSGMSNSTQYVGLIDDDDGWAIGYNGTAFSVFWKRGGSNVSGYPLASSSFNLDALDGNGPSRITLDPTKLNIYKISFGWLGASPIVFEILKNDGIWFPFHIIKFQNTEADATTYSSILPIRARVDSSGVTGGNVILKTPSWCCGTIGGYNAQHRSFQYYPGDITTTGGAADNSYLWTVRNNSKFPIGGAINNKIDANLNYFSGSNKSATSATFRLVKNITFGTSPTYASIDGTNSCIEYDTTGTYSSGGTTLLTVPLAQKDQFLFFFQDNRVTILLHPGDTLTCLADVSGNSTLTTTIFWNELF